MHHDPADLIPHQSLQAAYDTLVAATEEFWRTLARVALPATLAASLPALPPGADVSERHARDLPAAPGEACSLCALAGGAGCTSATCHDPA